MAEVIDRFLPNSHDARNFFGMDGDAENAEDPHKKPARSTRAGSRLGLAAALSYGSLSEALAIVAWCRSGWPLPCQAQDLWQYAAGPHRSRCQ